MTDNPDHISRTEEIHLLTLLTSNNFNSAYFHSVPGTRVKTTIRNQATNPHTKILKSLTIKIMINYHVKCTLSDTYRLLTTDDLEIFTKI